MAKNEDGEFELILGNNQLLSVFFLVVLLLALCFVGGYVVGRNAGQVLSAANDASVADPPKTSTPAKAEVAKTDPPVVVPPPVKTAPQVTEPTKSETANKSEPPKQEPPAAKAAPAKPEPAKAPPTPPPPAPTAQVKSAPLSSQPVSGRRYLQLSAVDKDSAEVMADLVRSRAKLPAIAAAIPERPGLFRVLVGPLADSAVEETRLKLNAAQFQGTAAISRVF